MGMQTCTSELGSPHSTYCTPALTPLLCKLNCGPSLGSLWCCHPAFSAHSQLCALHALIPNAYAYLRLLRSAARAQSAGLVAAARQPGGRTGPLPAAPLAPTAGQLPQKHTACKAIEHGGAAFSVREQQENRQATSNQAQPLGSRGGGLAAPCCPAGQQGGRRTTPHPRP